MSFLFKSVGRKYQSDVALMAIFVGEVDQNFDVVKEFLSIASLKSCAISQDVFKELEKVMKFNDLSIYSHCDRGHVRSPFYDW